MLAKIDFSFVGLMKKGLMVAFFITALQFLDMMPLLWNFPFGRGESSYDIKLVSKFLQADSFLQAMATIFFALFLFMSVLLLLLVVDENNIRRISEQKELNEHMLMETRMRILENRTYMELRHLVHDLKSPLTSMQALVGVVKLSAGRRGDQTEGEYLERIETMIDRMSSMISEILHEEQRSVVTTQELLDAVVDYMPSPVDIPPIKGTNPDTGEEEERPADPKAPFASLAFKIMTDPYVGKLTYLRVYSGHLDAGSYVLNATKGKKERIGRLLQMHSNQRVDIDSCSAGDIVAVVGLIRTYGIGLIAGPAAGIFADKLKSPSKSILIFFAASVIVLAAFMIMPREASMVIPIAVLVVVLGFVTYGAFSIGSSPLTEAKVPMSIFGTASGLLSVIGFLPDTFVHTWFGGLIDAQGADAFNTIFVALVVFAVLGCFCLVMTRRAMKKNAAKAESAN